MTELKHETVQVNGIKMHYVTAGKGPLVILLHGFPQFWYSWRHQIPALAERFQVVAPDLRGYGDTDKPPNVSDYRASEITADIVGLIKALGKDKAHIVGHDWGGSMAWRLAIDHPENVDRLVVLNSPHPKMMGKALSSNFTQMRKSWYIFFFQLPYLPELMLRKDVKKLMKGLLCGKAIRKGTFTDEDIQQYTTAFEKPDVIPAALNYYRAAFRERFKGKETGKTEEKRDKRIAAPTLLIWGEGDTALGKELTYGMEPLFKGPFRIEYVPNCSHWVHEEQPERVNDLLLEFLK